MSPMTPMPRSRADQGIGRGAPFTGGLLARQDEATGARARQAASPLADSSPFISWQLAADQPKNKPAEAGLECRLGLPFRNATSSMRASDLQHY